jgi:hypothetical protein
MTATAIPDTTTDRVLVGRFSRYRDLKRAMDALSVVARIPDRRMTVLGQGLEWSPPLTAARAARIGGWLGVAIGGASGLLFALAGAIAAGMSWFGVAIAGAAIGGALGMTLGLAFWRICRDRSMLPESGHVEVRQYDLLVERDDLDRARGLLGD